MDMTRARDIAIGIALETAGRALGWVLWLVGLWVAVACIVGTVVLGQIIAGFVP